MTDQTQRRSFIPSVGGDTDPVKKDDRPMTDNEQIGCSNGYCDITGKATGMHTNGVCNCLRGLPLPKRGAVRAELDVLRAQLLDQRKLLACERESSSIVAAGFKQALADLAQAERTCERRTAERDDALRELLAPTRPRYSAANLALGDPDETGEKR